MRGSRYCALPTRLERGGRLLVNVRIALRPLRLGILVRHGDFEGLWKAVRYNTCLWGGYFNPIIPVRDADLLSREERGVFDPPLADYLVQAFEVDLLYPISDEATLKSFSEARGHLEWPLGERLVSDEGTRHGHLTLLDVKPIVRGLRSSPSSELEWAVASLPIEGWRANFVRIMCGDVDGAELGTDTLRRIYSELRPSETIVREGLPLDLRLVTARWPIHLSTVALERFRPRHGWTNPGVVLGDATNFDDLVAFWNLRAAGNDVTFFPTHAMTDAQPLMKAHIARVSERGVDALDGPAIWYVRNDDPGVPVDEAPIAEAKKLLGSNRAQPFGGSTWNGLNIKPVRVAGDWESVVAHFRTSYGESAWLDTQLPGPAFDRPLLDRWNRWQRLALDVSGGDFKIAGSLFTLSFPPLPRMNTFIDQGHAGARVRKDRVSFFIRAESSVFPLRPVAFGSVMREVLAHCGFSMRDSVPGKYSRRVIELMGGVEGCRVLKMPGVRKLLTSKAARTGIGAKAAREIICDRNPVTRKNSFSELGLFLDGERADPAIALRHLVKKGILRPGVALECPKCGERTWYAMTRLRTQVRCECCGAMSGSESRLEDRLPIAYRIAPLWRKAAVQYGVIPVTLALWRLEEAPGIGSGRYITSAELSGHQVEMEVDFLGLIEEPDRRPMLLAGECKGTHERRSEKMAAKIEKLNTWYEAVEKSGGIKACIAFVTIEQAFDAELLTRCERMVREQRRVLLLTARELDPYFPYADSDDVPHKHPVWMRDLVTNGIARYLPAVWREQQGSRAEHDAT